MSEQHAALLQAIDAAWEQHAQPIMLQVPTGCDSRRQVNGGEVMGRLGFNLAVMAVVGRIGFDVDNASADYGAELDTR